MTVHIAADALGPSSSHTLGSLRMSAANARAFLTNLRDGHSPIIGTGDEDGTVQIEYEITESGHVLLVRKLGQRQTLHRCVIDRRFDLKTTADETSCRPGRLGHPRKSRASPGPTPSAKPL